MVASRTFDSIVGQILSSNLNLQIQLSPFSANIALKKSPIKDKTGAPIHPSPPTLTSYSPTSSSDYPADLSTTNLKLEKEIKTLRGDCQNVDQDREAAYQRIKFLESQHTIKVEKNEALKAELLEKNNLANFLKLEVEDLTKVTEECKAAIEIQKKDIQFLEDSVKKCNAISDSLNKQLNANQVKFGKEKTEILKSHKAEVKAWREDLGEETKQKRKLEEKLKENESTAQSSATPAPTAVSISDTPSSNSTSKETLCSICAVTIVNYIPVYFLDETVNPACEQCKDDDDDAVNDFAATEDTASVIDTICETLEDPITPKGFNVRPTVTVKPFPLSLDCFHPEQCIIRQPFPPPLPALQPIVNYCSRYHEKTMAGELDWGMKSTAVTRVFG